MLIRVLSERFVTITFMQVCESERAKIVAFYALFQQSVYIFVYTTMIWISPQTLQHECRNENKLNAYANSKSADHPAQSH